MEAGIPDKEEQEETIMAKKIDSFQGAYRFLSNFHEAPVRYQGTTYRSNESAFQAQKTLDARIRMEIADMDPSRAKRAGRHVKLRPDWETVKDQVMLDIVRAKFAQHPDLAEKLLATGDAELVEGNTWHDRYWGVDAATGEGRNQLGKTLMQVRDELRKSA